MRNKFKILGMLLLIMITFTNCNSTVEAGHKGKILSKNGWLPETYPPSRVWLDDNIWNINPEKLYQIETTTKKYSQGIKVLLKDKQTIAANIIFRGRITGNDKVIGSIFNDMQMNDRIVTTDEVYAVYGKMIVLNTARAVISKYNVDELPKNYARITVELFNAISPKLKGLPIDISDITIGQVDYPKVVTDAIDKATKRRMEIETEKAAVQIKLVKLKGKEELAKGEYRIKMMEAKRIADYNKKISEGVTKDLLKLRTLEIQEKMVEAIKDNKNVIYMPMNMMDGVSHMKTIK